jgi:hypothetical protein
LQTRSAALQQYGEITSAACQACTAACTVMGGQLQLQVARRSRGFRDKRSLVQQDKRKRKKAGSCHWSIAVNWGGDGAKLALALPSVTSSCSFLDLE